MGRIIALIVVIVLAVLAWMYFTDTEVDGGALPDVDVEGGEAPDVEVRGPEFETGTEEISVEVPTVDVNVPEDDADGVEDEIVDDEGLNTPEVEDVDVDVNADVETESSRDPGNN